MTNHWVDMQHAKAILVEGSNVAENHPMAFKWIRKAQENGAVIIHVDPRITGIPAAEIQHIAETMVKNRPGTILYALGMTQHTTGVQGIRGFTILQLLLGNIGKPGSGVNALRGEPNVQGACDMGVLNNYT